MCVTAIIMPKQRRLRFGCFRGALQNESTEILFTAAKNYLRGVMNGNTALPLNAWKKEHAELTAVRNKLNSRYVSLKDGVKVGRAHQN